MTIVFTLAATALAQFAQGAVLGATVYAVSREAKSQWADCK